MATTTPADIIITTPIRAQLYGTLDAVALLDRLTDEMCEDDEPATVADIARGCRAMNRLSAQITALRAALADSDEPRPWAVSEDEAHDYTIIMAGSRADALSEALDNVDRDSYGEAEGTIWIDVRVRCDDTGEEDSDTVTLYEDAPDCVDGHEHDWQSPFEVLGGDRANPGVWGHGGGVIIREVCQRCGAYAETDTWAQRRDTGEQGLTSVRYEPADEASLAWVQSTRDQAMEEALAPIVDVTRRDAGRYVIPDYAPDSTDYDGDTEPGSPWDEDCDRLLAEIRAALPAGWTAEWSDNDVRIDWEG